MYNRKRFYESKNMETLLPYSTERPRQSRSDIGRYDADPATDPEFNYFNGENVQDDIKAFPISRRQNMPTYDPNENDRPDWQWNRMADDGYRNNETRRARPTTARNRQGGARNQRTRYQERRTSFSNNMRNIARRCGSFNLDLSDKGQAVIWGIITWLLWCFALLVLLPPPVANATQYFTVSWWWLYIINIATLLINLIDKIHSRNDPYCFLFPENLFHLLSFLGGIPASIFFVCVLGHRAGNASYLCSLTVVSKIHVVCVIAWLAYKNYLAIPDLF